MGEPVQIEPGKTAFLWLDGKVSISITHEGHTLLVSTHKSNGKGRIGIRPVDNNSFRVITFSSLGTQTEEEKP